MNIVTVVNSHYMPFAEIFFNSLTRLTDYRKIKRVFVVDTGLDQKNIQRLTELCNKVTICETKTTVKEARMHSSEWREVVSKKIDSVIKLTKLMEGVLPLCVIDVDSYFNNNFIHKIDMSMDMSVCKRDEPVINQDNYVLTHIGSFFSLNNHSARNFLKKWRDEMSLIEGGHVETPALCNLLHEARNPSSKIQHIDQQIISATKFNDDCCIFHLKSDGPGIGSTIDYRINKLKQYV
jgi:hypothetical protein